MKQGKRRILLGTIVLTGWLVLLLVAGQGEGYYWNVGYIHNVPLRWGVSGTIRTINPTLWFRTVACVQWVTVVTSIDPGYWIQVGYCKGANTGWARKFYVEKYDVAGVYQWWFGTPSAGSYHDYEATNFKDPVYPELYRAYIDSELKVTYFMNPFTPQQLRAMSEQWYQDYCYPWIKIDGTHFNYLARRTDWGTWGYWESHEKQQFDPYVVVEKSHWEFEAYGGDGWP